VVGVCPDAEPPAALAIGGELVDMDRAQAVLRDPNLQQRPRCALTS